MLQSTPHSFKDLQQMTSIQWGALSEEIRKGEQIGQTDDGIA